MYCFHRHCFYTTRPDVTFQPRGGAITNGLYDGQAVGGFQKWTQRYLRFATAMMRSFFGSSYFGLSWHIGVRDAV